MQASVKQYLKTPTRADKRPANRSFFVGRLRCGLLPQVSRGVNGTSSCCIVSYRRAFCQPTDCDPSGDLLDRRVCRTYNAVGVKQVMKLQFLGTGAADWKQPNEDGEYRRYTSTLIDGCLLIDVTGTVLDQIADTAAITDVFFTHSHKDHFSLDAMQKLAPCRVWAHESWAGEIAGPGLDVHKLKIGEAVETAGLSITPLPSNHSTAKEYEKTLHYILEKGQKQLLYATDGAWLLNEEHRIIGDRQFDAVVFDATIGEEHGGDWRIFEHNSVAMVRLMTETMLKTGRVKQDAPVFLTHLARTLHPSQAEIEKHLEKPFVACRDGMTAEI